MLFDSTHSPGKNKAHIKMDRRKTFFKLTNIFLWLQIENISSENQELQLYRKNIHTL